MKHHISSRAAGAKRSAIRELLKLTEQPEIISFGGGLPAPETLPHEELARIAADELQNHYHDVLQYSTTEGSRRLRRAVCDWLRPQGVNATMEEVLVTTASQQGLDLMCKAFFDPGDAVFCGLPTYLGAVQAFSLFQLTKIGIPLSEEAGMDLDVLEERISEARAAGTRLRGIYVVPNFQNPSGITMGLENRKRLLEIARREDLLVFEDDPYGQLRFTGEPIPPIASMDTEGRVVMLVSFSKMISAGLRLAFMVARGDLMDALVRAKQATDLCTSKFTQVLVHRFITEYGLARHLDEIRPVYRAKRNAMLRALEKHMPDDEGIRWTKPEGGLFIWMWLPEGIDTERMLERAMKHKVAYVPGAASYVDGTGQNTLRLAFSAMDEAKIEEGIRRLGLVVKEEIAALKVTTGA